MEGNGDICNSINNKNKVKKGESAELTRTWHHYLKSHFKIVGSCRDIHTH